MKRIVVGITQRVDYIEDRSEFRDALDQNLARWVGDAGLIPVAIPNIISGSDNTVKLSLDDWLHEILPGAIVLSGGNDIGDYPDRDATENDLLTWAEDNCVPVLGICRGMQMMAIRAGAELIKKDGHVGSRHHLRTTIEKSEWPVEVNSYHDWVINACPNEYKIAAQSEDGSIEAIKHVKLPWEGWMWHPEREDPFREADAKRFMKIIDSVKQKV